MTIPLGQFLLAACHTSAGRLAAMPSMKLYGRRWHLASDALPLFGLVLMILGVALLVVFACFLATTARPVDCNDPRRLAVVYGTLSFLGLNTVMAAAMIWVGTRGGSLPGAQACAARAGCGPTWSFADLHAVVMRRASAQASLSLPASAGSWDLYYTSK